MIERLLGFTVLLVKKKLFIYFEHYNQYIFIPMFKILSTAFFIRFGELYNSMINLPWVMSFFFCHTFHEMLFVSLSLPKFPLIMRICRLFRTRFLLKYRLFSFIADFPTSSNFLA